MAVGTGGRSGVADLRRRIRIPHTFRPRRHFVHRGICWQTGRRRPSGRDSARRTTPGHVGGWHSSARWLAGCRRVTGRWDAYGNGEDHWWLLSRVRCTGGVVATGRSSVLVGRHSELAEVDALLGRVQLGQGGAVLVVGEAGIGKSRLLAEAAARARQRGLVTLFGRAVEDGGAYRAMAEALVGGVRDDRLAERPEIRPYRAALGRLIPGWARADDVPATMIDPAVLLGEGVLRLLRLLDDSGCLLVLEDLQWADAETLALVEYLAAAVAGSPVLLAASARDDHPPAWPPGRLDGLAGVTTLRLARLDAAEIGELAEQCNGGRPVPDDVRQFLIAKSEGLPFLVEELLAGVRGADPPWSLVDPAAPVPPTLAGLVGRRLAELTPEQREVLEAAAVLGHDFEPAVLAAMVGLDEPAAIDALHVAAQAQLLVEVGDEVRWRHALTRDAALATVFAPRRAVLARRAAVAYQRRAGPGDEIRAAELLATAGEESAAAEIFLRLARRDLADGALRSADGLLARAAATRALQPAVAVERVHLFTLRGEPATALEVGRQVVDEVVGDDHAELCLRLAQAALAASRWAQAERYLERAGRPHDPRSLVLAANAAFGAGDLGRATRLAAMAADRAADRAEDAADAVGRRKRAEDRCAALTVLGRCTMRRDPIAARDAFARAAQIAAEHGLRPDRITALMGVGTIELFDHLTSPALRETRELAIDTGMLAAVISIDLAEVDRLFRVEGPRAAEPAARRNAEQAQRLRLYRSQSMADLYVAAGLAAAGDTAGMQRVLDSAVARPHASAEVTGAAAAVRALRHLIAHDLTRACGCLDTGVAALGPDGSSAPGLAWGLWALLRTVIDDRDAEARDRLRGSPAALLAVNRGALLYADAVAAGRAGQGADAEAWFRSADQTLAGQHWWRRLLRLLALEAAVADGWGEPVVALRADLAAFERTDEHDLARTCRDLLRRAGTPTRRGRGNAPVPARLRSVGVTAREMDVLVLVADGLTNRQIAERLFVSPRTVETHVASLLAKTGTASRADLRTLAEVRQLHR
jgi:DNA-binding CsgD family transcriptional regulator/RecA/RadA recombinase